MKFYNVILMTISFGLATIFGYYGMNIQMGLMIVFFLTYVIFANLDKFEYFKINKDGLEAKMKKLAQDLTLAKKIATVYATLGLTTLSRSGHWDGISKNEKEKIKDDLILKLKNIGVSDNEIGVILNDWHEYILLDYYIKIYNELHAMFSPNESTFNKSEEYLEFEKVLRYDPKNCLASRKSSKIICDYIGKTKRSTKKIEQLLDDYEYYEKNKKHKSLERWLNDDY